MLRVGDLVVVHFGTRDIEGRVVEDLGRIGVRGRQLVRVRAVQPVEYGPDEFEMPAEELQVAAAG